MAFASLEVIGAAPHLIDVDALPERAPLVFPEGLLLSIDTNTETKRSNEMYKLTRNPQTYEIDIESDITLEDYELSAPDILDEARWLAQDLQGRVATFINPTYEGGGVAMLRPALVHALNLLGVDAHWFVMSSDEDVFKITKTEHNVNQRQSDHRLSAEEKQKYLDWTARNFEVLKDQTPVNSADVIIIDDPQPAGLIKPLKNLNPSAKFVWRNHIDSDRQLMADPTTPQGELWQFWRDELGVDLVDAAVFHPVEEFVPSDIVDRAYFAPATIELHDDLNRQLSNAEIADGLNFINDEIEQKNQEFLQANRYDDIQPKIDPNRKIIGLVARFDESKGMDKAMKLGALIRQQMRAANLTESDLPQIVIVGNGSVDDPSGTPMYEKMLKLRREEYNSDKGGFTVMRLKHNYQAINALMEVSTIGLQTSDAEGCETRITDWIRHGKPVFVANRGGMPMQVIEGKSGGIIDYDQPDHGLPAAADEILKLLLSPERYEAMQRSTFEASHDFNERDFATPANMVRWLRIFDRTLSGQPADKLWQMKDLVKSQPNGTQLTGRAALVGVAV